MNYEGTGAIGSVPCASCGKINRQGVSFCEGCGSRLPEGAPRTQPVRDPSQMTSNVGVVAPMQAASALPATPPALTPQVYPGMVPPAPYPSQQLVVHHTISGPGNNGLCVASMVLGIIAIVFMFIPFVNFVGLILAILAVVFGAIGIPSSGKKSQSGKGMGIAGLVLGVISLALTLIFIFVVYAALLGIASGY